MVLQNIGYTVFLLGVLVVVHEFGHFIVAKSLGVKVLKFSVGFGPRLLGFTKGETEYRLSLLPLGGYVRMAGDVPGEELPAEEAHRGFLNQPPWKRGLIVAAGPAFNLIFPVLVYIGVFLAYPQPSTRIMSIEPGLPAAIAGLQIGDRVLAVNGDAVTSFDEMRHRLGRLGDGPALLSLERDGRSFAANITPIQIPDGSPGGHSTRAMLGISPSPEPPVVGVPPGSAAELAGLKSFDRIVSVDGAPVKDLYSLRQRLDAHQGAAPVELQVLRETPAPLPGTNDQVPSSVKVTLARQTGAGLAALGVERKDDYVGYVIPESPAAKAGITRGDKLLTLNGTAVQSFFLLERELGALGANSFALKWRHGVEVKTASLARAPMKPDGEVKAQLLLGAEPDLGSYAILSTSDKTRVGFAAAVRVAVWKVEEAVAQAALGFWKWATHQIPVNSLGSPLMIYKIAAQSAQAGLATYLDRMALISVSLGVMNLLPIPILDGFHLFAAFWEGIRRRPIPVRAREIANMVGLAMLIILMVVAFTNDLTRAG